jgi:DNA-binding NarL/FixJ family response regulator
MSNIARSSTTVFLVDGHPLFMEGIKYFLTRAPDMTVVGETSSGSKAVAMVEECTPDIALLDTSTPEVSGLQIAEALTRRMPSTQVIMLSPSDDHSLVSQAIGVGARGFVLKGSAGDNLLFAIRSVARGGFYIDPTIAGRMVPSMSHSPRGAFSDVVTLTQREAEVLRMIAMGYMIKEIAALLGITSKSVETYKIRASEKMQLGSRAKIVQFALRQGWLQHASYGGMLGPVHMSEKSAATV